MGDTTFDCEDSALLLLSEVNAFVHNNLQQDSESLGDSIGTHELANFGLAKIIKSLRDSIRSLQREETSQLENL
jgi:hypothetical protein